MASIFVDFYELTRSLRPPDAGVWGRRVVGQVAGVVEAARDVGGDQADRRGRGAGRRRRHGMADVEVAAKRTSRTGTATRPLACDGRRPSAPFGALKSRNTAFPAVSPVWPSLAEASKWPKLHERHPHATRVPPVPARCHDGLHAASARPTAHVRGPSAASA